LRACLRKQGLQIRVSGVYSINIKCMNKQIVIVILLIVGLVTFALIGLGKFIDLNLADLGVSDIQTRKLAASDVNIVRLISCQKGKISFLPSIGGSIEFDPDTFRATKGETISIVNRDSLAHEIGVSSTHIILNVNPAEYVEIDTSLLAVPGPWGITCDGINLGDKGPLLYLLEPF